MRSLMLVVFALASLSQEARVADTYPLGPDSLVREGVPKGWIEGPRTIYPNTVRQYWIYVPAQYDSAKAAALMVFQDGHQYVALDRDYRVPTVFDNLIAAKAMPVTIGVFVNPGHAGEELPKDVAVEQSKQRVRRADRPICAVSD